MSFQVSPGINVSEIDLTAGTQTVSVSDAAFAGPFQWGPASEVHNVDSEDSLVSLFGKPDDTIYQYWFSAASFLAYSDLLRVVRVLSANALNATAAAKPLTGTVFVQALSATVVANAGFTTTTLIVGQSIVINSESHTVNSVINSTAFTLEANVTWATNAASLTVSAYGIRIQNSSDYDVNFSAGVSGYNGLAAKYAGETGNNLKVSVCPSANAYANTPAGSISLTAGSNTVTGTSTAFTTALIIGDYVVANGVKYKVASITNTTSLQIASASLQTGTFASTTWSRQWEFAQSFDSAPGTSNWAATRGASGDEMHVAVVDEDGGFTGVPGTVLERYAFVSKASGAKDNNGNNNYYADVLNRNSAYVWWLGTFGTLTSNWGSAAGTGISYGSDALPTTSSLAGGRTNNAAIADADLQSGYDKFKNKDEQDISLVITGPASAILATYVIQNICESRGDCVAFVSPTFAAVVNNPGGEVAAITAFRNSLPSSSYGILGSGWKYTYDKYNDKYRWVPLNGDTAGVAARADTTADPWVSPAGFSRGTIKNVVKLAWNPKQQDRDDLYKIGVNPIVSFPTQGVVLYGDKTMLSRPSAFDRINVRRLFIILEKTISQLARASLFEFNDEFTRSQFRNSVEPFLRDVKARRGVTDYRVICDDSNNTDDVVESNRFVGDIYIKPSRSVNFIQLNFVAVRNGVSFQEVTGTA